MNTKKGKQKNSIDFISVNTASEIIFLNISDIVRLEAQRNYTLIVLHNDKKILSSKNLKEFEEVLVPYQFLRIHKSHLVNPLFISHFIKKGTGQMHLKNDCKLQVSEAGKERVLTFFKNNSLHI